LKEANETKYWLGRLHSGNNLTDKEYDSIKTDNEEIIKILTSITGKVKRSEQE
jgi:four helix bundle protein